MATSGIWNHAAPANSLAANSTAHPATATASSGSGDNGSNISSNDFLTLLVTEMQNQDPTASTDPNEYINQLVQVNSLEQLISINQTLSTDLGSFATGGVEPGLGASHASLAANSSSGSEPDAPSHPGTSTTADITGRVVDATAGNLAMPQTNSAADRVAHAFSSRTRTD